MDTNYDNENKLSQVSMETDQSFAPVLFRGAAKLELFYTIWERQTVAGWKKTAKKKIYK